MANEQHWQTLRETELVEHRTRKRNVHHNTEATRAAYATLFPLYTIRGDATKPYIIGEFSVTGYCKNFSFGDTP